MRIIFAILLFLQSFLLATDFDVAVVGTSPIAMLESIYHLAQGERVLILEMDDRCGGAWKSIDICGVANVDLGCHLIGKDPRIKDFFERHFGCKFVCMEHPFQAADSSHDRCGNGYYFSQGCYELISSLENRILGYPNAIVLHQKLDSIYIDGDHQAVELEVGGDRWTTGKLIVTGSSHFRVKNLNFTNDDRPKKNFPHYYYLIEDERPFQFTYMSGIVSGMSRAMNLTPFIHFPEKNLQMIAVQVHSTHASDPPEKFFQAFIEKNLLSPNAKILKVEAYHYHQGNLNANALSRLGGKLVEVLQTSAFSSMNKYLDKWSSVLLKEGE